MAELPPFSAATKAWLSETFAEPTPAQRAAWQAIGQGDHTLVVAPTGSGKTLAAFLWSIDQLMRAEPGEQRSPSPEPARACRVVYVSPLKALAVDIDRNLRAPLAGVKSAAERLDLPQRDVTIAVRTGDTPPQARRAFSRRPADILITTPESLYLLLTSAGREALRGVETVIVDEVHAVCATKRGSHLALTLERLDALLPRPAQRIGLSATVRPVEEVARFLGGSTPVTVVQPPAAKTIELTVEVPVDDMSEIDPPELDRSQVVAGAIGRRSLWPAVEERVHQLIREHRSTIVFVNSRQLAERLCAKVNELAAANEPAMEAGSPSAPTIVARAHHGSVSHERRREIEDELKAGRLPAVIATSSLELGIDMGAVDLVIQVESPPSVAAGLQRIGRAGHHVGALSRGTIFPKHRGDLVSCAVVATRMASGQIEEIRYPRNALDVLAQQIVAMVALDTWPVDELAALVRRAAPFAELPDSSLRAVLDMLAGVYPSDDFAELRPRLSWDRRADLLTGRSGAQRLAVTNGGTIPDRGLFGVFLAGTPEGRPVRVGELDEEMVYESRIGDVFTLGSSSWRVADITHDRVSVTPAPGAGGKPPFWKGETLGRPLELGLALGAFLREVTAAPAQVAAARAKESGLDERAVKNLLSYLSDQREAAGCVPDDRTILVERFRDELGDWRIVVHSLFGAPINAPWAMLMANRVRDRLGIDAQVMHADDGIVLRLPDSGGSDHFGPPAPAELGMVMAATNVEPALTAEVGSSPLFASRFRECAARALLLPRRNPGQRSPLWQQRQRSAQLLAVAGEYSSFPIVMEALRECLHDVFNVPGLVSLMTDIEAGRVRVVEVETAMPSPFARSILFAYTGAFLYAGDAPLAERRAQALAVDSSMLTELLGDAPLRELLDTEVIHDTERELQYLTQDRRPRDPDGAHDLLRALGALTEAELAERGVLPPWLGELEADERVLRVRVAGEERLIAIEDAARYRDALGAQLPSDIPAVFAAPVRDPLADVIRRYSRTHGPFTADECGERLGITTAAVKAVLRQWKAGGSLVAGEFRPGGSGLEWCDSEILRRVRRRTLAALRKEIAPAAPRALAAFLPEWHGMGAAEKPGAARNGREGLLNSLEQLQGALLPATAWENLVLPSRVADYQPGWLDELCGAGEIAWCCAGSLPGGDAWLAVSFSDAAAELLPAPTPVEMTAVHEAILHSLDQGQALFFRAISAAQETESDSVIATALWELVWGGYVSNDTLAPLRAQLSSAGSRPPRPITRLHRPGAMRARLDRSPATLAGRWYRLPGRSLGETGLTTAARFAQASALLERLGVVTREGVLATGTPGGFAGIYPVLAAAEEAGQIRRGYFVEGLGAAQFANPAAVEGLRATAKRLQRVLERPASAASAPPLLLLAATDPANPYGAMLPWPPQAHEGEQARPSIEGRKPGAIVVLADGELVAFLERGGKSVLTFAAPHTFGALARLLSDTVRRGQLGSRLSVERIDGEVANQTALGAELLRAGFSSTPRGALRLRR